METNGLEDSTIDLPWKEPHLYGCTSLDVQVWMSVYTDM